MWLINLIDLAERTSKLTNKKVLEYEAKSPMGI